MERPGVPREDVEKALGKSSATIRRSLDRLQDTGRILLTGTMSRKKKLYGIVPKKIKHIDPAHASGEQA